MHWVRTNGAVVADYRVISPASWHFHPEGPFVQVVRQMPRKSLNGRVLRQVAGVFDPFIQLDPQVIEKTILRENVPA